jgi:hypothetical protein
MTLSITSSSAQFPVASATLVDTEVTNFVVGFAITNLPIHACQISVYTQIQALTCSCSPIENLWKESGAFCSTRTACCTF